MRFWDSSAIVSLLISQTNSALAQQEYEHDRQMIVWWGTTVECASAIARLDRDNEITRSEVNSAQKQFRLLADVWNEVAPNEMLRRTAERNVRSHALKAADAFQLAAADSACRGTPENLPFMSFDKRLAEAARKEGFPLPLEIPDS